MNKADFLQFARLDDLQCHLLAKKPKLSIFMLEIKLVLQKKKTRLNQRLARKPRGLGVGCVWEGSREKEADSLKKKSNHLTPEISGKIQATYNMLQLVQFGAIPSLFSFTFGFSRISM